jgi:hypothetical protein
VRGVQVRGPWLLPGSIGGLSPDARCDVMSPRRDPVGESQIRVALRDADKGPVVADIINRNNTVVRQAACKSDITAWRNYFATAENPKVIEMLRGAMTHEYPMTIQGLGKDAKGTLWWLFWEQRTNVTIHARLAKRDGAEDVTRPLYEVRLTSSDPDVAR